MKNIQNLILLSTFKTNKFCPCIFKEKKKRCTNILKLCYIAIYMVNLLTL